jgi:hypothetical protein
LKAANIYRSRSNCLILQTSDGSRQPSHDATRAIDAPHVARKALDLAQQPHNDLHAQGGRLVMWCVASLLHSMMC